MRRGAGAATRLPLRGFTAWVPLEGPGQTDAQTGGEARGRPGRSPPHGHDVAGLRHLVVDLEETAAFAGGVVCGQRGQEAGGGVGPTLRSAGAILLVRVPATIMTSDWRGLARKTTPKRSMS